MNKLLITIAAVTFVIGYVILSNSSNQTSKQNTTDSMTPVEQEGTVKEEDQRDNKIMEKPELTIDETKTYTATLETSQGNIVIELFADKTPITVNNFVYLSSKGFYDGTIFHRVIDGFMIQGGDPNGDGTGGPGYKFDDEPFEGEYTRGTVAMANSGPNTNGSQFFIMHADYPLPKNYVIFGKVKEGIEVVDKIATSEVEIGRGGEKSKPVNPVVVKQVTIKEE